MPGFLYSVYLTLYKTDISLRRTLTAGPKGVRLRGSWLYISYTLYVVFDIYFTFFLKYGWFSPLQKTCNSCQTGTNCVWLLTAIVEDPIVDEMFLFTPLFRVIIKQIFLLISIQCNIWTNKRLGHNCAKNNLIPGHETTFERFWLSNLAIESSSDL